MRGFDDITRRVTGNLQPALAELTQVERQLWVSWTRAMFLRTSGALTDDYASAYNRLRAEVSAIQQNVFGHIRSALEPIGQAHRIEAPFLPPAILGPGAAPAQGSASTVHTAGLGAVPVVVWAAAVAFTIVQLAAIAAVVWGIRIGADMLVRIYKARQNTRRYQLQVESQEERFRQCLTRGGTPSDCGRLFPAPAPPLENTDADLPLDPVVLGVGIVATVLSVGAVAYFFYQFASPEKLGAWRMTSSEPTNVSSARGKPTRLGSSDIPRALRGGR